MREGWGLKWVNLYHHIPHAEASFCLFFSMCILFYKQGKPLGNGALITIVLTYIWGYKYVHGRSLKIYKLGCLTYDLDGCSNLLRCSCHGCR